MRPLCGLAESLGRGVHQTLTDNLAEGSARDEILRSYPSLRAEHLDAALAYAAELAHEESLGLAGPLMVKAGF